MNDPPDSKYQSWVRRYENYKTSYSTTKTSLKSIIRNESDLQIINRAVVNVNKIVIHTYNFLKLYYLYEYNNGRITTIDKKLINTIMKTMCIRDNRGSKPKEDTQNIKSKLEIFLNEHYKPLIENFEELYYTNLNTVLDYEAIDIMTNITNHISEHFEECLNRYINVLTKKSNYENNIRKEEGIDFLGKKKKIDQFRSHLKRLKKDILLNENKCLKDYNHIKKDIRKNIFSDMDRNVPLDKQVLEEPLKFLPSLIKMNVKLVDMEEKTFNCFPLRENIKPKYITFDTTTIIHLLFRTKMGKHFYLKNKNTKLFEDSIWYTFFKTNENVFIRNKYKFNHQISTDGIGCSILFIRKNLYHQNQQTKIKIIKKPHGRKLSKEQLKILKKDIKKAKIVTKKNFVPPVKKPFNYRSERYVDELTEEEKIKFRDYVIVGVDPNKGDLIYCTNGEVEEKEKIVDNKTRICHKATTFRYTQNQRRNEMKIKDYRLKRLNDKKNTIIENQSVEKIESKLSQLNSKSCVYKHVQDYIKTKSKANSLLLSYYEKDMYRQLNWYTYINKQKSESKMINNFKETFGNPENVVVCFGDWSENKSMKYFEPTKGKGMRKLFRQAGFNSFLVNEYNTSCKGYLTGEDAQKFRKRGHPNRKKEKEELKKAVENEGVNIKDLRRRRKIHLWHGLLRFNNGIANEINKLPKHILMNRDLNASLNIRHKAYCIIHNIELPSYLCRKSVINIHNVNFKKLKKQVKNDTILLTDFYLEGLELMAKIDNIKHRRASSAVIY